MQREYYDCQTFVADGISLAKKIDWSFDTIVPIARGGLSLGHLMGEYFDMREVYAVNTVGYEDTEKLEHVKVFNIPDLQNSKHILVLDDIVDTGDTLIEVLNLLQEKYPEAIFKSAALFYKKSAKIAPDWYVKEAVNWIDFFWASYISREELGKE